MAVEPDDLVEQFDAEAVHHAHHDDQRGDAEHHRDEADRGDEEDEALALPRKQIAPRDHSFVARKDHAIAVPARKNGDEPLLYGARSEEHTSELQSLMRISYDVFCLKKKNKTKDTTKASRKRDQ